MKGRDYSTFKIKDLSGGINTTKSPNEIDDKQCTECINFNFEGNKLTTSKGIKEIYSLAGTKGVQGLKVIGSDVYHISDGDVYKNGTKLNTTGKLSYSGVVNFDIFENYMLFTDSTGVKKPAYMLAGTITEITNTTLYNTISGLYAKYVIVYNGKSIWGGQYRDTIVYSKTANATTPALIIDFSVYNSGVQSVGGQMSGDITGFSVGENGLYVFKRNEVYYSNNINDTGTVNPTAPSFAFIFNKISSTGCVSQQAIANVKQEIFFYDDISRSLRRLGYEQNLTTLKDTQVSEDVEYLFDKLPSNQNNMCLSYYYPNIKMFLHSENSKDNDVCISYNVDSKAFSEETNKTCSIANGGYLGDVYSNIIYKDDITYTINGVGKEGIFTSKKYDLGEGVNFKNFGELEILGNISFSMNTRIQVLIDDILIDERIIDGTDVLYSTLGTEVLGTGEANYKAAISPIIEKIDLYNPGRYIQLRIITNGSGYIEISNFNFRFKLLNAYYNY